MLREVSGRAVVMSTPKKGEGRKMCQFSETAAWLWEQAALQGEFTVDSLTKALCEVYDVETSQAHADVQDLLALWQREGLAE